MAYRYDYIARAYGREFVAGQRVTFTEDGRTGTVVRTFGDPAHVRVRFDDGSSGNCHPLSVDPVA